VSSPYQIPLVDLRAQYAKLHSEIRQAVDEVLETQQFILGPAVTRFEEEMAAYLQCGSAIGVASGSDALLLALMALGVGHGDGVIVTPFTFFSTVSSITRLGATPLFVDIDPESYLISVQAAEKYLDERTRVEDDQSIDAETGLRIKAVLPVHLFGRCCDMAAFASSANKYNMRIVEDVAQACGAKIRISGQEKLAGTMGDLGCFSFFPSKTLGGFGDGGLVTTHDKELAKKVKMLRIHGESTKYHHQVSGINSRLDSIQAAVLSVKQRYLDEWCNQRILRAEAYHQLFTESGLVGNRILSIPAVPKDGSHVFNNYVIRAQQRDELKGFLAEHGVQSEIYYPLPVHLQNCFAELGSKKGDFPRAELAATQVLALPIYPELSIEQQERVVSKIADFYRG
jgi:dTDP-4-amino-4,6-dideoxygalactose transaminase